jgi:hypothetical protein
VISQLKRILRLINLVKSLGMKRLILGLVQSRNESYTKKSFKAPKSIRDRNSFVKEVSLRQSQKFPNSKFLELGPYMSPILTKPEVDYFDVLDTQSLINRSKIDFPFHDYLVVEVDFVGPEASEKYIPNKYSLIVSSHVIEHQIDLLRHLQQVSNLLVPGGLYLALIPDLRYCFDHFQYPSTIVDVLVAHNHEQSNHSLKSYLEDRLLTTHNVTMDHWNGISGESKIERLDSKAINYCIEEYLKANDYLDVHGWKFTPTSFKSIIETLERLELINLELMHIAASFPGNNEFWVIFEKN